MSKSLNGAKIIKYVLLGILFLMGAFISLLASALLFNDSWRQTVQVLNSEALVQQQCMFASGVCIMLVAISLVVWSVLKKEEIHE